MGPEHTVWLEAIRRELFRRTLIETYGNISEAARRLGVHRQTVTHSIEHYPGRRP
jgi:ActR/RegA family two-component response regulator